MVMPTIIGVSAPSGKRATMPARKLLARRELFYTVGESFSFQRTRGRFDVGGFAVVCDVVRRISRAARPTPARETSTAKNDLGGVFVPT